MARFTLAGLSSHAFDGLDMPSAEQPLPAVPANGGWYRGFQITFNPKPGIPARAGMDWDYLHPDYDGPEDGRYGCCSSAAECAREIDEYYEAREEEQEARS